MKIFFTWAFRNLEKPRNPCSLVSRWKTLAFEFLPFLQMAKFPFAVGKERAAQVLWHWKYGSKRRLVQLRWCILRVVIGFVWCRQTQKAQDRTTPVKHAFSSAPRHTHVYRPLAKLNCIKLWVQLFMKTGLTSESVPLSHLFKQWGIHWGYTICGQLLDYVGFNWVYWPSRSLTSPWPFLKPVKHSW